MGQYPVLYSRLLTGITLGFHIIFATIGVGVPLMIALAYWIGLKHQDSDFILLAKRWTRGFSITVAIGVVTGTAIGLQLSLLWPAFMKVAGQIIALPLFLETFAFFLEAIFLGIFIYTWDRMKNKKLHFLTIIPVVIGSSFSALFITIVNAFMNTPRGFTLKGETITNIQPILAMFNPAMPTKVAHVLSSAYMTCAFILAAIAGYHVLKGRRHVYYKKALHLTMMTGFIFSVATLLIGDLSGKFLAVYQPVKLAAAEWHFKTAASVPLKVLGTLDKNHVVHHAIQVPFALSFLAHDSFTAKVIGLDAFKKIDWPPLMIHYLFDCMVIFGTLLLLLTFWYLIVYWRRKGLSKWLLVATVISGPLAILTIECGWIFTELGRQPWILVGYLKTVNAATTSANVGMVLIAFCILYVILGIGSVMALRRMFKGNPAEKELQSIHLGEEVV